MPHRVASYQGKEREGKEKPEVIMMGVVEGNRAVSRTSTS